METNTYILFRQGHLDGVRRSSRPGDRQGLAAGHVQPRGRPDPYVHGVLSTGWRQQLLAGVVILLDLE